MNMAIEKATEFEIDHRFDPVGNRHYLNGVCSVLHCHHYATLYTQLALDATDFEGVRHLLETSEDVFHNILDRYFSEREIATIDEKIELAQQYWQAIGMGLVRFTGVGIYEVLAEMEYSHIDEGWLKKWGGSDRPVNYMTAGFVAAVAALLNDKPSRSFTVRETQSLACGDEKSKFKAVVR